MLPLVEPHQKLDDKGATRCNCSRSVSPGTEQPGGGEGYKSGGVASRITAPKDPLVLILRTCDYTAAVVKDLETDRLFWLIRVGII